jgi:hypothetical protein
MNLLMGTDEDKNTLTKFQISDFTKRRQDKKPATIRNILQHFSELLWNIDNNLFCKRMEEIINNVPSKYIFISDVRRLNELVYLKNMGVKLIKLTKKNDDNDTHSTENELDLFDGYDYIIDNDKLTIHEKNEQLQNILIENEILSKKIGVLN